MESKGQVSYRDIEEAYRYLGTTPDWDDASIIGAFQARVSDAPRQEQEARQHLRVIGVSRHSEAIQTAASNRKCSWHHYDP